MEDAELLFDHHHLMALLHSGETTYQTCSQMLCYTYLRTNIFHLIINNMNEENKSYLWHWFILVFVALVMLAVVYKTFWLAGTSVGDYLLSQPTPTEKAPTIVITTLEKPPVTPKPIEKVETKVKEVKAQEKPKKWNCTSKVRLDLVNHAYRISWGDMKFLWTIASESMFDVGSVGDGGKSIGLCQFHRWHQPDNWKAYQTLESDFAKLEFCHEKYSIWKKKGILHRRLYWSNVWEQWLEKLEISCNPL